MHYLDVFLLYQHTSNISFNEYELFIYTFASTCSVLLLFMFCDNRNKHKGMMMTVDQEKQTKIFNNIIIYTEINKFHMPH